MQREVCKYGKLVYCKPSWVYLPAPLFILLLKFGANQE